MFLKTAAAPMALRVAAYAAPASSNTQPSTALAQAPQSDQVLDGGGR